MSLGLFLLLSCTFLPSVDCEFVSSSTFGVMDRCLTCKHYLFFMRRTEVQDVGMMDEVDRELGRSVGVSSFSAPLVSASLTARVALNHQILDNPYWYLPVDSKGHEDFSPVGRDIRPLSNFCGLYRGLSSCDSLEKHKGVILKDVDYTDKRAVVLNHFWCKNGRCPVCFIRGYSCRGSRRMTGRLDEGVRLGFGKVEHGTVSPPKADWGLPVRFLKEKCLTALFDRGWLGGVEIFHGYRIDRFDHCLRWGVHWHVLGFIDGGFDRCRACVHSRGDCDSCSGFKGREVRGFAKDGCLVKVFAERESVGATSYYQLNHATIRTGMKRFHSVSWFGNCGNRKFKALPSKVTSVCHVCGDETKRSVWVGKTPFERNIGSGGYRSKFGLPDLAEDGSSNFVDVDE